MRRFFFIILALSFITGCSSGHKKEFIKSDPKFCIPDSLMNQLTFGKVAVEPVIKELKLIGKITFDLDKVVHIYPLVSGNVVEVKVSLGAHVTKGQVLAVIKSAEMAGAKNDLVTVRSNLAVAEKNYASSADMYKSGILSDKEYISAQKELDKANSELERVNTILSIYGNSTMAEYIIKSPVSGFVVEKFINANMQIRPDNSTNLFTISDLKNVWAVANVYESDIAGIKENENVEVTTLAYPDKAFQGKVNRIFNVLDPDNKTMKVQIKLINNDYLLKPEMFANVLLHQPTDTAMLSVPADAVIFDKNHYWVLVFRDKCNVQVRKLDIVSSNSKYSYVRSGVKPGEIVITKRHLLIYSALTQ